MTVPLLGIPRMGLPISMSPPLSTGRRICGGPSVARNITAKADCRGLRAARTTSK